MKVLVFGASGRTGQHVMMQALAMGHDVAAVIRRPEAFKIRYDRLHVKAGDALDLQSLGSAFDGRDAVISALGTGGIVNALHRTTFHHDTARNILAEMKARGVRRFFGISSVGVDHDPTSPFWYRNILQPMMRHTYADLAAMEALVRDSGLDWTLIRPNRLTDGMLTQSYRTADGTVPNGTSIARADVADLIIRKLLPDAGSIGRVVALSY